MFTEYNLRRIKQRGYAWVENWGCTTSAENAFKLLLMGLAYAPANYTIVVMIEIN